MHAILVSMGTDGDVLPFVGAGVRLRARGHRVTLVANEHYQSLAAHHGFGFRALVSEQETKALLGNPNLWHPVKSALVGARWARRGIARQYEVIAELARDPDAVLVAYPPVFAARLVQLKLSRPLANLVPMPWMILSEFAPPTLPGILNWSGRAPRWVVKLHWRLLEAATDLLIGRQVSRVGKSLGLGSIRGVYRWCLSPQLIIGLFPEWYAPAQPDWPPQLQVTGFARFDGGKEKSLPEGVLDFCRTAKPPIAFTFGTGMMHGARLFRAAINACEILGARGILLTRFPSELPASLPPSVHHCSYASFQKLFPHCAAIVHHGGVGTTAQALAAGVPQLVLPMAWDQPDNAARVRSLGVGDWLLPNSSGARIANALTRLMRPEIRARCQAIAARFSKEDAFELAAQWIEELAQSCRHSPSGRTSTRAATPSGL